MSELKPKRMKKKEKENKEKKLGTIVK